MSTLALTLIAENKKIKATRLDLGNCGLTELPVELFELEWLEELNFRSNKINDLTPLEKLTGLTQLDFNALHYLLPAPAVKTPPPSASGTPADKTGSPPCGISWLLFLRNPGLPV
jgi:hypothetical protein